MLIVQRLWVNFQARTEQITLEWIDQTCQQEFQIASVSFVTPNIHPAADLARRIAGDLKTVYCGVQLEDMSGMLLRFNLVSSLGSIMRDVREMEMRHAQVCRPRDALGRHMLLARECRTWEEFAWLYYLDSEIALSERDRSWIRAGWERAEPAIESGPPKWSLPNKVENLGSHFKTH